MRRRPAVLLLAAALTASVVPAATAVSAPAADLSAVLGPTATVTGDLWVAEAASLSGEEITYMAVRDASGAFTPIDASSAQKALGDAGTGDEVSVTVREAASGEPGIVVDGDVLVPAEEATSDQATEPSGGDSLLDGSPLGAATTTSYSHPTYLTYLTDSAVSGSFTDATARATLQLGTSYWKRETLSTLSGWAVKASKSSATTNICATAKNDPYALWKAAAAQHGLGSSLTTAAGGDTLVVFVPSSCLDTTGFTGLTTIGTNIRSGGLSLIVLGDEGTMAHELGHELGLGHSNVELGTTLQSNILEYGGIHSVMGIDIDGTSAPALDVALQYAFGVIPDNQVTEIAKPGASGVTLAPVTASSGVRAALFESVDKTGSAVVYGVEYRDGKGVDATAAYAHPAATALPLWDSASTVVDFSPGVRVFRLELGDLRGKGLGSTTMTNPASGAVPRTATLTAGRSYQDPAGNFAVTVGAVGATAAVTITTRAFASLSATKKVTATYGKKRSVVATLANKAAKGTVTVREGSKVLGRGTVSGGRASVTLPTSLKAGSHTLVVAYGGVAGTSGFFPENVVTTLSVKKAKAKATIKASRSQLKRKKTATVKVYLKKVLSSAPTGKVYLKVGSKTVSKKVKVKKSHGKYVAVVKTKKLTKKGKVKVVFAPKSKNLAKTTYATKYKVR